MTARRATDRKGKDRKSMDLAAVLLGFLAEGNFSGYDLKRLVDERAGFFFGSPSHGAIYPALADLRREGFVRVHRVAQKGRPDKKVHSITPAGEAHFRAQLAKEPVEDRYRSDFLVRLFFGEKVPPEQLLAWIRERRTAQEKRRVGDHRQTGRGADSGPSSTHEFLCRKLESRLREAEIAWLDEAQESLAAAAARRTGTRDETPARATRDTATKRRRAGTQHQDDREEKA